MAKTKRDWIKREMAQAIHNIENSQMRLGLVYDKFDGVHDDYAEYLELIGRGLEMSKNMLLDFWTKAWGPPPSDLDVYRI